MSRAATNGKLVCTATRPVRCRPRHYGNRVNIDAGAGIRQAGWPRCVFSMGGVPALGADPIQGRVPFSAGIIVRGFFEW